MKSKLYSRSVCPQGNCVFAQKLSDSFLLSQEAWSPAGPRKYENWHFVGLLMVPCCWSPACHERSEFSRWRLLAGSGWLLLPQAHPLLSLWDLFFCPQGLLFVFLKCDEMKMLLTVDNFWWWPSRRTGLSTHTSAFFFFNLILAHMILAMTTWISFTCSW